MDFHDVLTVWMWDNWGQIAVRSMVIVVVVVLVVWVWLYSSGGKGGRVEGTGQKGIKAVPRPRPDDAVITSLKSPRYYPYGFRGRPSPPCGARTSVRSRGVQLSIFMDVSVFPKEYSWGEDEIGTASTGASNTNASDGASVGIENSSGNTGSGDTDSDNTGSKTSYSANVSPARSLKRTHSMADAGRINSKRHHSCIDVMVSSFYATTGVLGMHVAESDGSCEDGGGYEDDEYDSEYDEEEEEDCSEEESEYGGEDDSEADRPGEVIRDASGDVIMLDVNTGVLLEYHWMER